MTIWRSKPRMPRRGCGTFLLRFSFALAFVGTVVLAAVVSHLRSTNAQSDVSPGEWQRIRERWFGAATAERAGPAVETGAAPTISPVARLPLRRLESDTARKQRLEYLEEREKNVVELQQFRDTVTMTPEGNSEIRSVTLTNLNPRINAWYLLSVERSDGRVSHYHLANARPRLQDLTLDTANPDGITITDTLGGRPCDLWSEGGSALSSVETLRTPYVSLCEENVTLRLSVPGHRTTLEWATDFLRDNVWSGERITTFIRENFFQDAYLETAPLIEGAAPDRSSPEDAPRAARLDARFAETRIGVGELGLLLDADRSEGVVPGQWYRARHHRGVFVSVVRPDALDRELLRNHRDVVSALDEVEREALVYLVAFDLSQFDVGFALGTEHPRVGWSARAPVTVREPSLPGPDGIPDASPLVMTGTVPPSLVVRTVATFTGGFKRDHGAFRVSALSTRNRGTHYGFIESGTILSKLQPGLSTIYILEDGRIEMKTWNDSDEEIVPSIAFARQNGLPIVEPGPTGLPVPGRHVSQWAAGNWSGSQDRKFRTVRGGTAMQELGGHRFLIYAYFSSATPSAMARVFEAYGCSYGMLLDMNALEHTYMALYRPANGRLEVQHLVLGMEVLDKTAEGQALPRFLGIADNRDFFYVLRKDDGDDDDEGFD